jgi:hypothetical protein
LFVLFLPSSWSGLMFGLLASFCIFDHASWSRFWLFSKVLTVRSCITKRHVLFSVHGPHLTYVDSRFILAFLSIASTLIPQARWYFAHLEQTSLYFSTHTSGFPSSNALLDSKRGERDSDATAFNGVLPCGLQHSATSNGFS